MMSKLSFAWGVLSFAAISANAMAQEKGAIERIEVTAQKRVQPAQEVPISITVVDGEQISKAQLEQAQEVVALSPNVNVTKAAGGMMNYFVRGVGMDGFNLSAVSAVGVYLDDVALSNPMATAFSLYDIERVELLKGPQNTLFGKNTTGGAITFYPVQPSLDGDSEQFFALGLGNYGLNKAQGAFEWATSDDSALRLSGFSTKRDGIISSNVAGNNSEYGNIDRFGARLQFIYRASDTSQWLFNLHGAKQDQISAVRKAMMSPDSDGIIDIDDFDIYRIESRLLNPRNDGENLGGMIKFNQQLSDMEWVSITAYDRFETARMDDWSAQHLPSNMFALNTYNSTDTRHFSQELRIQSSADQDHHWLLGAFYTKDSGDLLQMAYIDPVGPGRPDDAIDDAGGGPLFDRGAWIEQNTQTFSLYGHQHYKFNDQFSSELGFRWSRQSLTPTISSVGMQMDHPDMPFPLGTFGWYSLGDGQFDIYSDFAGFDTLAQFLLANGGPADQTKIDKTFNQWGAKLGINYQLSDDAMLYVSLARGYKMGTVNSNPTTVAFSSLLDTVVEPETLVTLEGGFKSDWWSRRLRVNGAVFTNRWQDYQFWLVSNPGNPAQLLATLANVPKARSTGAELDVLYKPFEDSIWSLSLGWLDSEITDAAVDTTGIPAANLETYSSQVANGNRLTNSPRFNYRLSLGQDFYPAIGELNIALSYRYTSSLIHQIEGNNSDLWIANYIQPSTSIVDLNANLIFGGEQQYRLTLWSKNLLKEKYCTERNAVPASNTETIRLCNQADPLTYGLTVSVTF